MKKIVMWLGVLMLMLSCMGCTQDEVKKVGQTLTEKGGEYVEQVVAQGVSGTNLTACGDAYNAQNLSYNVYGVQLREDGNTKHLVLSMEVLNNSDKDISFSPMMRLELLNANGEECSWNMMIGKLDGVITPNNKLKGDVAFDVTDIETSDYTLSIGNDFELNQAIAITSEDIGKTYPEIFETSGVVSEFTVGVPVLSERFDMEITEVDRKPSDKEGLDILLITLSMTNNASEASALGFEIDGVYTAEGEELNTAVNEWTFTNWPIESNTTETGIVSYYVPEAINDFYMTVRPNISDFNNLNNIVFSVEPVTDENGTSLISSMAIERPDTLSVTADITAFGTTTTMTTYYDGNKSKTEVSMPDMPMSIMIHIPNQEVMYQYVYGESTGVKITGATLEGAQQMGMMMDTSILATLVDGGSEDITTSIEYIEELGGEEVIYIEATQSDDEVGEILVKMWYSEKYATPLKYQIIMGETIMTDMVVTKIHDNVKYNADTFMPPADIEFQEVDMDTMMQMW